MKKAGCLTKSHLEVSEEGSYIHSHGVAKCILWYNDKRLWTGGYNLSGSITILIVGIVYIDRNLSKNEEKHTVHREAVRGYETAINLYATS